VDVAILCHFYYERLWNEITSYIDKITTPKYLYFNVVTKALVHKINNKYPEAKVTVSENRGADIGGFFTSIDEWLKDGSPGELMIKCHTKGNDTWRRELFEPIFNNDIIEIFKNDKVGMVGSEKWLQNGKKYDHVNELCSRFQLKPNPLFFIGGTVFCIRSNICKEFFSKFDAKILKNELELGKPREPSKTHAWERLLGKPFVGEYFMMPANKTFQVYDEDIYLSNYADVKQAVHRGEFSSGFEHYLKHGRYEQRVIKDKFDEDYYLAHNPDVDAAVKRKEFSSGFEHYLKHGHLEKRKFRFVPPIFADQ